MADAKLGEQRIDGADLHPGAPATVAQVRGFNVILPVRRQKREGGKALDDVLARSRAAESLEQLLQDEARDDDDFAAFESAAQRSDFRGGGWSVPAESQRPDARVDEQAHRRERSAL